MEEKYNESEALLTVKDLKMHFPFAEGGLFSRKKGAVRAVDGISFSVKKGETLGLVGESGCGKSTLGRCLLGMIDRTAGKLYFHGREIPMGEEKSIREMQRKMQIIFQDPYSSLNPYWRRCL